MILDIQGLGPVKAEVTTVPFVLFDGEYQSGASVGKRNIILIIGLNPNWAIQTIEELRQLCYAYFMPKQPVRLKFTSTHLPECQIDGVVEDVVPNIFAKNPQLQISIICPAPDFVAVERKRVNSLTIDRGPFTIIQYNGTEPAGFYMELRKGNYEGDAPGSDFQFTILVANEFCNQVFKGKGKITGTDYTVVSTIPGQKYVHSVVTFLGDHAGRTTNYLGSVDSGTGWPKLYPGVNEFAVVTPGSPDNKIWLWYNELYRGL